MVRIAGKTSLISSRLVGPVMALVAVSLWVSHAPQTHAAQMRWDIISLDFGPPVVIGPGGIASAAAADGSKITLTGNGTFLDTGDQLPVTGGGTWTINSPPDDDGNTSVTGSGTYSVTGLVSWVPAPGTINPAFVDTIGNLADTRAGLVLFDIEYSDGSNGHLLVSCALRGAEPTTPLSVFEGITATKDFVAYSLHESDLPGVDANRTLFHIPEPAAGCTALLGLAALAALRRRFRRGSLKQSGKTCLGGG